MNIKSYCLVVAILIFQGCATKLYLHPVKLDGQMSIYQEGTKSLISQKSTVVAIRPLKEHIFSNERLTFIVSVNNSTEKPFDFSTENIEVTLNNKKLKVYSYQELVEEIEKRQKNAALIVALNGMAQTLQASSASTQYHSGTYNTTYLGNGSNTYATGSYSGYTYDPAAAIHAQNAANAYTLRNLQVINESANKSLNHLQHTIMKKQTVLPSKWYGGYIKTDPIGDIKGSGEISVNVAIAGSNHNFKFLLAHNMEQPNTEVVSKPTIPQTEVNTTKPIEKEAVKDGLNYKQNNVIDSSSYVSVEPIEPECKLSIQLGIGSPIDFSPNGKYLLSRKGSVIKLVDIENGRDIKKFPASSYSGAKFSPDGQHLFIESYPSKLYDTASGQVISAFKTTSNYLFDIEFSSDGKYLLLAEGKNISLWDVNSGEKIRNFEVISDVINRVCFGPNDKYVVSWSHKLKLNIWDIISGNKINSISFSNSGSSPSFFPQMPNVAFSSNGMFMLYSASSYSEKGYHNIELWDIIKGVKVKTLKCPVKTISNLFFNHNDKNIIVNNDDSLTFWDISSGEKVKEINAKFNQIIFSNDKKYIFSSENELGSSKYALWNIVDGKKVRTYTYMDSARSSASLSFSENSEHLISVFNNGSTITWDIKKAEVSGTAKSKDGSAKFLCLDTKSNVAMVRNIDDSLSLINIITGKNLKSLKNPNKTLNSVSSAMLNYDKRIILTINSKNIITLFDFKKDEVITNYDPDMLGMSNVVLSNDGKTILSGDQAGTLKIWDVEKGKSIKLSGETAMVAYFTENFCDAVTSIAISPNNEYAMVAWLTSLKLIDLTSGKVIKSFPYQDYINRIVFSYDGRYFLTSNSNGTLKLWDLIFGNIRKVFKEHNANINSIIISNNSKYAASASSDGLNCLWNLDNGELLAKFSIFEDGEWVFLTPSGYYTASSNGDKYLKLLQEK